MARQQDKKKTRNDNISRKDKLLKGSFRRTASISLTIVVKSNSSLQQLWENEHPPNAPISTSTVI